jgi:sialate O-acetylesterase
VTIDGPQHVELHHVLVGDVWLCGGQSNMEFGLPRANDGAQEVAAADQPNIRLFTVATRSAYAPVDVPKGAWKICSPQTVAENGGFSAVAYFFARRLQRETGVPIGLIQDCLGGTPVECWMSPATLHTLKDFDRPMAEVERLCAANAPGYGSYLMHWLEKFDVGARGKSWADPALDDAAWKIVPVPGGFAEFGLADVPAIVWFRREITLPDPLPAGDVTLHLGVVEKMDTAYINGQWVGASSWVENPRAYRVASNLLKPGRNQITVRVFKLKSKTGFLSGPEQIHLAFAGGPDVPLAGEWKAAVSVDARPPHPLPLGYENYPTMPSVLYDGMIAPIAPLALTGAIWYQGEANSNRAYQYRTLLPLMIADWRRAFGQGDFPFLIAQLPAFQNRKDQPGTDDWAELREAQALTAHTVPNCGLAVTIDTGEADNIHPKAKQPVGDRLALLALAQHYGKKVVSQGPVFRALERRGAGLRVRFDHTDGGFMLHGDKLAEFSVAGADRKWHWADAKIDGDTIVVASAEVPEPVAVRYAWQANPQATLFNGAALPAAPFRSDDWPGVTEDHDPW